MFNEEEKRILSEALEVLMVARMNSDSGDGLNHCHSAGGESDIAPACSEHVVGGEVEVIRSLAKRISTLGCKDHKAVKAVGKTRIPESLHTSLRGLLSLHDEYLAECESIAYRVMETIPSHESFMSWLLGVEGDTDYQYVLEFLEGKGYEILAPCLDSTLYDKDGSLILVC